MNSKRQDKNKLTQSKTFAASKSFILHLAEISARQPGDREIMMGARVSLGVAAILASLLILGSYLLYQIMVGYSPQAAADSAKIIADSKQARVLYHVADGLKCHQESIADVSCPAHPDHQALWQSSTYRGSTAVELKAHRDALVSKKNSTHWVGFTFNAEQLRQAREAGKTALMMGYLMAEFDIYVNGTRRLSGNDHSMLTPLAIDLGYHDLVQDRLQIAIKLENRKNLKFPDQMPKEGLRLLTYTEKSAYLDQKLFENTALPMMAGVVNLVIAAAFIFFWKTNRHKHDFAFLAIFCLLQAAAQFATCGRIVNFWEVDSNHSIQFALRSYEAAFAMLLGFTMGRLRWSWMRKITLAFLFVPPLIAVVVFYIAPENLTPFNRLIATYMVPGGFFIGGVFALLQAFLLHERRQNNGRKRQLELFFGVFIVCGLIYISNKVGFTSEKWLIHRFGYLMAIFGLSWVVIYDYQTAVEQNEKQALSKYHRRAELPPRVDGIAIRIDLKGYGAIGKSLESWSGKRGAQQLFSSAYVEYMTQIVSRYQGEFLKSIGDELIFMFDEDALRTMAQSDVLNCLKDMEAALRRLETEFKIPLTLGFRGCVLKGYVIPSWNQLSGKMREQDFHEGLMIETQRFMEGEKSLKIDGTVVLIERQTWTTLKADTLQPDVWGQSARVKESASFEYAAICLCSKTLGHEQSWWDGIEAA